MFLDDSACNLASLNLMKFATDDGRFDVEAFHRAVDLVITAQEIIVDNASYPTEKIARNSHAYRPLGLGYANLGALLMYQGIPYDSDAGRDTAAAITALMTGQAYLSSALVAGELGPFAGFPRNRESMLEVIDMHRRAVDRIDPTRVQSDLFLGAREVWEKALEAGQEYGYKNAQASVLAPTGTIGLMMDCDTTGVEPDLALVKFKKLVGGGVMKIVNQTVPAALKRLGYQPAEVKAIVDYIETHGHIEGAPGLKEEHLPVFDCAVTPPGGSRSIHYMGHIRMMAAVQPFLSGAISKTVNMPQEATVEEIMQAYLEAWKLGLKAIAIYRDGSKRTQPLNTIAAAVPAATKIKTPEPGRSGQPVQRKLPVERNALTHKFSIAGHEGYITVGMYEDGSPGEIFINMSKEGSTVSGLMDAFARAISYALQYGVPLEVLVDKFTHTRFEPSGFTGNQAIPYAKSITDYIFRWLALKFLPPEKRLEVGLPPGKANPAEREALGEKEAGGDSLADASSARAGKVETASTQRLDQADDAPPCSVCGSIMVRNGSCYKCLNCGTTSGCS
jgi:ribonucleoside-diphosphate reductase alpha chain